MDQRMNPCFIDHGSIKISNICNIYLFGKVVTSEVKKIARKQFLGWWMIPSSYGSYGGSIKMLAIFQYIKDNYVFLSETREDSLPQCSAKMFFGTLDLIQVTFSATSSCNMPHFHATLTVKFPKNHNFCVFMCLFIGEYYKIACNNVQENCLLEQEQ